jgi:alpha-N-arabinofuranosidase
MIDTTLTVRTDAPVGTISPRLYGHFAEHLERCCYDGLWVGLGNKDIPNIGGFRTDVINALKAMPVPMLRWPGGCYADHYHWRDGIGAPENRAHRLGMSCGLQVEDDNGLGTHEFIAFCRLIGAEPYLAGNMGSGSVQELCDWVEYCNATIDTDLTRERAANGSREPFGVKLWGVGNENWGCGGSYDAETYAQEYRRYATMLRHVDPKAELVVCGHTDEWNEQVIKTNRNHYGLMDHFSIHRYWINGNAESNFTADQYYNLLAEAQDTENFINTTAGFIREYMPKGGKPMGIALDEWGVWHPEARPWGPDHELMREPLSYEQADTMRDALAAGVALEVFHRQCNVLSLANLAQIVNVLHAPVMTEGAAMWLTPTYYALQLHTPHIGATALPVEVTKGTSIPNGQFKVESSAVSATASKSERGTAVTLINRHFDQAASVSLVTSGVSRVVKARILAGDSPRAQNSIEKPDTLKLADLVVNADGSNQWRIELPACSMATIEFSA